MDKKVFYAKISRFFYRTTFKPGLYKYKFLRHFDRPAIALRKKFMSHDALICLPKQGTIEIGETVRKQDIVLPLAVVDHFIEKANYLAVMNYCICRESNECKDYSRNLGCLFMGEAAKGIHPDLCRQVTKEEAREHVRKCRAEGLIQVVGRAWFDCVWLDIGPHDRLFTVCNCCPCCCITLATPYLHPEVTDWLHRLPGLNVLVSDDCIGCGACVKACVYNGVKLEGDRAVITDECRGCGRCVEACPQKALSISIDMNSARQAIDFLEPRVDVS